MAPNYTPRAIRKLNRLVPEMVLASLANQALKLRKIIGSTFEPAESLRAMLGGMPQSHRELVLKVLSERSLKAYEAGSCDSAVGELRGLSAAEIEEVSKTVAIPRELQVKLLSEFETETKRYLEAFPKRNEVIIAVESELQVAYQMGIEEAASAPVPSEPASPAAEVKVEEAIVALEPGVEAAPIQPVPPEQSQQSVTETTAALTPDVLTKLEQYTKLLGDPISEKVLRAVLGLPQKVMASTAEAPVEQVAETLAIEDAESTPEEGELSEEEMAGPFLVPEMRAKTLDMVKTHKYTAESLQVMQVDCLVPEFTGMSDDDKAEALAKALDQKDAMLSVFGSLELQDVLDVADLIAEELTEKSELPGEFLFLEIDGKFCLCFCFDKSVGEDIGKATESLVTAAAKAPKMPSMGKTKPKMSANATISEADRKEVAELAEGPEISKWLFKDLKKKAPSMADHISQLLKDARNSVITIGDLKRELGKSQSELIGAVYGETGVKYFLTPSVKVRTGK